MRKSYPVKPPVRIGEIYEETCRHCGGTAVEPGLNDLTCRECMGRGRRRWRIEECQECEGKGRKNFIFSCPRCQGRGWRGRDVG
jgi:DnaJ-class molecular chaperone